MPSFVQYGSEIKEIDLLDLFPPDEGSLRQYYGRIRNGKTYAATCDVLDDVRRGQVVYTNWPIVWDGRDQRQEWLPQLLGLLGLKKSFYVYPKGNLHYCDLTDLGNVVVDGKKTGKLFYDWFAGLTSCICYFDEGHIYYDSYMATKMDLKRRLAILDTGHYDRVVNIISQRPSAIHVVLRANVNQFFKCEKSFEWTWPWHWVVFVKTEFQDTGSDDKPNEEREIIIEPKTGEKTYGEYLFAVTKQSYFGKQKVFKAYNAKFRRGNVPESQLNLGKVFKLTWSQCKENFFSFLPGMKPKTKYPQNVPKPPLTP